MIALGVYHTIFPDFICTHPGTLADTPAEPSIAAWRNPLRAAEYIMSGGIRWSPQAEAQ